MNVYRIISEGDEGRLFQAESLALAVDVSFLQWMADNNEDKNSRGYWEQSVLGQVTNLGELENSPPSIMGDFKCSECDEDNLANASRCSFMGCPKEHIEYRASSIRNLET